MPPQPQAGGPIPKPSQFLLFEDFSGGMNTQSARIGLPEKYAAWMENLQPVAPNFLLGVQSPVAALATLTGETIVKQFQTLIGTQDYIISFCASGAGYACTVAGSVGQPVTGGVVTKFAPAGTFSATGPDMTTFTNTRILIADSRAGYSSWDGIIYVGQGGVSPNIAVTAGGSGYVNPIAVSSGGTGSGDTYQVNTVAGVVTSITLLTPGTGFLASDVLTLTITDSGGGTGATANAHVWPFVSPNPTTLAVAFGRVWLGAVRTLILTGTGSATYGAGYDDFQSADASVTTVLSDTDLVHQISCLRFLENYLYIIGDNSVKSIGSISVTSGVTNFTITTISSDQGTIWPQTVISYDRLVLFANASGVFAVFGASVEKISPPMDGIFFNINFNVLPSAAVNDLNQIHTYLLLVNYNDPQLGARGLLLAFSNKRWHVINQGYGLAAITTVFLGGHTDTFGSSGSDITQLLQGTITPVPYKLQTAQTANGNPIKDKRSIRIGVAQTAPSLSDMMLTVDTENGTVNSNLPNASAILTVVNNANQVMSFVNNSNQPLTFTAKGFVAQHQTVNNTGRWMGATATGTLNGIAIQGIYIEYQDGSLWGRG